MQVKIKRLQENAVIPTYAKPGDAGLDITCVDVINNNMHDFIEYKTGLAFEIPEGYVGLLFPRSSNSKKDLVLSNSCGILDAGFRGEVTFRYKRLLTPTVDSLGTRYPSVYSVGDRIGQIIIMPIPKIEFIESDALSDTERGDGGYGSSGK